MTAGCLRQAPQIIDIFPSRGAGNVRTNADVKVSFDRPVDRASVAAHFELRALGKHPLLEIPPRPCPQADAPLADGSISWASPTELVFRHQPLETDTEYQVVLLGGYRDAVGTVDGLCHYWTFTTERAPTLDSFSPGEGDRNVDVASYVSITFSRAVDTSTVAQAVKFDPAVPFAAVASPNDARTVLVAPQRLLQPNSHYMVSVSRTVHDADGNPLAAPANASFTTGPFRALHGWVGFVAADTSGVGSGVWVVDSNRLPKEITTGPAQAFSWAPGGTHLVIEDASSRWTDVQMAGPEAQLPVQANWVVSAGPGEGYVYLASGSLRRLMPDGTSVEVATSVNSAALDPSARRLAFTEARPDGGTAIDAYDLGLQARYRIEVEPTAVDSLAWSPDGSKLAYRLATATPGRWTIRVRDLGSAGSVSSVTTGDLDPPIWDSDSLHLVFVERFHGTTATTSKIVVVNTSSPPASLTAADGLPGGSLQPTEAATSPDGKQIAFIAEKGGVPEVWLMNADGSGATQLTTYDATSFPYSAHGLAWSPG